MQLFQDKTICFMSTLKKDESRPQLVSTTGQFSIQKLYQI